VQLKILHGILHQHGLILPLVLMIFFFEVDLNEAEGNVDDNLYKILLIEKIMIEKLNNHDMNKVVEDETPMQMLNLGVVRTTTKVVRRMVHRG
jgi:hypothetical protein